MSLVGPISGAHLDPSYTAIHLESWTGVRYDDAVSKATTPAILSCMSVQRTTADKAHQRPTYRFTHLLERHLDIISCETRSQEFVAKHVGVFDHVQEVVFSRSRDEALNFGRYLANLALGRSARSRLVFHDPNGGSARYPGRSAEWHRENEKRKMMIPDTSSKLRGRVRLHVGEESSFSSLPACQDGCGLEATRSDPQGRESRTFPV